MLSASEQPARGSGMSTVRSGARILAVSAMKYTPANTITRAGLCRGDPGQRERVADVVGHVLDLRALVVVRQDHRVTLGREPPYLSRPRHAGLLVSDCLAGHPLLPSPVRLVFNS